MTTVWSVIVSTPTQNHPETAWTIRAKAHTPESAAGSPGCRQGPRPEGAVHDDEKGSDDQEPASRHGAHSDDFGLLDEKPTEGFGRP